MTNLQHSRKGLCARVKHGAWMRVRVWAREIKANYNDRGDMGGEKSMRGEMRARVHKYVDTQTV